MFLFALSKRNRGYDSENIRLCKGEHIDANGYVYTYIGNRKYKGKHRVIIENRINRILKFNEIVHHINEIKTDNRIENLELMTREKHTHFHTEGRHHNEIRMCFRCGSNKTYLVKPSKWNSNTTPFFLWHHLPYDKTNWYCSRCYNRIWRIWANDKTCPKKTLTNHINSIN